MSQLYLLNSLCVSLRPINIQLMWQFIVHFLQYLIYFDYITILKNTIN